MKRKNKKKAYRMCISCRNVYDQKEMLRIVKNKSGNVSLDETGKMHGRGAYICKKKECVEKAKKAKALNRAFEMGVEEEIYSKMNEYINDK
jgi:predicted RNA-binding protein YlxR (DUF448 family)